MSRAQRSDASTTLRSERDLLRSQVNWRACCQSSDVHRFGAVEASTEKRGDGPFGPT